MLILGVALLALPAQAQQPSDPDLLCHPSRSPYDAVTAAPRSHRVLFEDDHVRVLEIVIAPLAVEPVHIHMLPSVIQGDTGGEAGARFAYVSYRFENGQFVEDKREEVTPTPGFRTVWSSPEGPHAIANLSGVGVRYMRTEIKPERCAKKG
jgi:hypothetical protein